MTNCSRRPLFWISLALAAAAIDCGGAPGTPQQQPAARTEVGCTCPAMRDPSTGTLARIFAGGPPGTDTLVVEDTVSHEAYRYVAPDWRRLGSSARTYAIRTNIYRLAGDAFAEVAVDNDDHWKRFGAALNGTDIFASMDRLYMPRVGTSAREGGLFRWDASTPTLVDRLPTGATSTYAGNDSGVYKAQFGQIYRYGGTPHNWTEIGRVSASALYPAAGTVFVRSGTDTLRYLGTPGQFTALGAGLAKIAGTLSAAYAIEASGNVVRLDLPNLRTTVRSGNDTHDIVAGGAHVFVLTKSGAVLRLESNGAWTDLSCRGGLSTAGCANGCEPGPAPTKVTPAYADAAAQTQNAATNVQYNVLTHHNDIARTGAATHETILTPAALQSGNFGYLGSVAVTGRIFGQPLYVEKAAVVCQGQPLKNANIAYVATLENVVHAIDVDTRSVCWSTPALGCPQQAGHGVSDVAGSCGNHAEDGACNSLLNMNAEAHDHGNRDDLPNADDVRVGIVGTPAIDLAKNVIYVVARHRDGSAARGRYFVHVLDIRTGQLVSKVEAIADTLNGRDDCAGNAFHPSLSSQRAGVLLANNTLFVAFSGNAGEDASVAYHGHVLGFDVSNPARPINLSRSFCATPNPNRFDGRDPEPARGGGIWMAGAGPASDGSSAYFTTGNGAYPVSGENYVEASIPKEPPTGNWPQSFVKLRMDMTASGYNDHRMVVPGTPYNLAGKSIFFARERSDADFGSGGVLLLGNRLIGGGKDGRLYVIDTGSMRLEQDFQAFVHAYDRTPGMKQATYDFQERWYNGPHIHGGPVAWDTRPTTPWIYVYAWAEKDWLKRFRFNPALGTFEQPDAVGATPDAPFRTPHGDIGSSAPGAMPGGMLSISSNGPAGGIVWATVQELYKFCSKLDPQDGHGARVFVDQPLKRGHRTAGCNVLGGFVPGRLYAFSAEVDPVSPGGKRLKLLWGDTSAPAFPSEAFPGTSRPPNNFIPAYAKHAPPTIAHGKVLVSTANGELRIYGLGADMVNHGPRHRVRPELTRDDILLTGVASSPGIDVAASNADGLFMASSFADASWRIWASTANVARLAGDFNGDGRTDVALVGGAGWTQAKVSFSNGNGTFNVLQGSAPDFLGWATSTTAQRLVGDFNGDGKSDIALVGNPDWHTIPLATSNGNGSFAVTNTPSPDFVFWASTPASTKLVGDFDGDGKSDIALVGNPDWHTIPIAFSRAGGRFEVANGDVGSTFGPQASAATERVVGDFNGDGRDDIALVGHPGWQKIPVAFADGIGSFTIVEADNVGSFAKWATRHGVTRLVGDFNGDGRADIALVNVATSETPATMPVAFSNGDGTFRLAAISFPDGGFRGWAAGANVHPIVGDFNRDGYADVALTGGAGWFTIPCALSKGDGSFVVHNTPSNLATFGARSAEAGSDRTRRVAGNYRQGP